MTPGQRSIQLLKEKIEKKYFWGSVGCFCLFFFVVGPFWGVQNRIYGIIRARIVRNGAKWPHSRGKYNYKKKKKEKINFGGLLGCFGPFLFILEHFGGSKIKNCSNFFFAGIDLESSETHFKTKISRKKSFLVQILSSCNLQKVSFMAADLFTWSFLPNVHYSFVGACQTAFRHPTRLPIPPLRQFRLAIFLTKPS